MASLKVYADPRSQPTRAVLLFCKMAGIEFEEVSIELFKGQHRTPEYAEINPMKVVPAIVHGDFKLNESHAILIYLASAFPGIADHWYPADLQKRAKIHSVLDWHHTNLRKGAMGYLLLTALAPFFKTPENPMAKADCEKTLISSLATIDSLWLVQGSGNFLLGNHEPSIADLRLVCEITQLKLLDDEEYDRFLGPNKNVQKWIQDVREATNPHFDEVHKVINQTIAAIKTQNHAAI